MKLHLENAAPFWAAEKFEARRVAAGAICEAIYTDTQTDADAKGWLHCSEAAIEQEEIMAIAQEIRQNAQVFVLVGVGGSNQAARAIIEALKKEDDGPEIVYAGNTLSAHAVAALLHRIKGKSVYINIIAKNFETLEPGSHFRVLRKEMEQVYTAQEMQRRIILTGTKGSPLLALAQEKGYRFLSFPENIGGRYSAFSPVGLLPIAVAGLDLQAFLQGVSDMENEICAHKKDNIAVRYADARNVLYGCGFTIEMLASFEPQLDWFSQWWIQLFGESEGKEKQGVFPAAVGYSEDLHSMGQYLQDGQRCMMETFLSVEQPDVDVKVVPDEAVQDGFDYLNGMGFAAINRAAQEATISAHCEGGVPCMVLEVPCLNEYWFGRLYYFFMVACAVSGKLCGINPFDQNGVEAYKKSMFEKLGKR